MVEADDLAAEDAGDVLAPAEAGAEGRHRPVRHVERRVHHRPLVLLRRLLKRGKGERRTLKCMGPVNDAGIQIKRGSCKIGRV